MRTDFKDVRTRAVTPCHMVNRAAFLWGGNAMSNIRLFWAATTVLVAALAVQVGEAEPRGTADIVWQHVSGQVHYWSMQGGQRTGGVNVATPVGNDWALRGVGDVTGDGTADIVWQHVSGQVHYWSMQGGQRTGGVNVDRTTAD